MWPLSIAILIGLSLIVGGCKTVPTDPTVPKMATLNWVAGNCKDNFIVYQQLGDGWIAIMETTNTKVKFLIEPEEEKVVTVSGVCMTGSNIGEWRSAEQVVGKW